MTTTTIIKKSRGSKNITPLIKENFLKALVELSQSKPVKAVKSDTATSLIIMHRQLIQTLLEMGYSISQIVERVSGIDNLNISAETLRKILRSTNENGDEIPAKKRTRKLKPLVASN